MINIKLSKAIFNDVYLPLLNDHEHNTFVVYGGAGSGKSVATTQILIYRYLQEKRRCLVVRQTLASQRETCWREFLNTLSKWQLLTYCVIKESEYKIQLPNGSEFIFRGLDNANFERIKSISVSDLYIEEADQISKEIYLQLRARLRSADDMSTWVLFNPCSKSSWVYKEWFEKEPDEKTLVLQTTYKDNKFLPQQYKEWLEAQIDNDPVWYKIYVLGQFCSLDKLIYPIFEIVDEDPPQDGLLVCGLDFGFTNDPTAFVASTIKDNELFIFKEWYAMGKTNNEIAEAIKELGFGKSAIIADSAEPKSIKELKECGLTRIRPSVKGPDSVIHGIQKMKQYKIKVHKSCVHTIEELQNYSWKKNKQTGEYENEPIDQWNHTLDAARYSLQLVHNQVRITDTRQKIGL